ncbi:HlyD family efflux transporter periplasmic adaptor subunit [Crassaminicella profunda]|uniref:HlyD family efflux transporter periplasmic adaptor subunit n=1 Tax=Crassaminicella profunda TaxID=1286698 RepID=UPI001CA660C5|nr:HlyD family efflux transporter periplasmic adaptor subunit [Crassaminicella profunda]QZY57142.1 hypothetical protein K7H06_09575 [Crassaminicella profunda]
MTKKNRNKRKRKRRLRHFFFGIILFYLIIKFMPMVVSFSNETSVAEYGNIQVTDQLNCYIIRNEKLIESNFEGNIQYFVQEGEKVEKEYKVAEIYKVDIDDTTRKKLEVVNQRIESIKDNENSLFQSDVKKIDEAINKIVSDIKEYKEKGNLLRIEQLKKELNNKLEKKRIITGDKSFAGKNLETLELEQESLQEKINNAICWIKSPASGIISYNIDGYEAILTPRNMATIELENLKSIHSQVTDLRAEKAIKNQPLFKIVDNNVWYMVTWIDKERLENYKVGRRVTFKFPQREVRGKVYQIIENTKNNMVIFQVNQYVENFYSMRNIDLDVIPVNYEGLKLYKDSIVEIDGKKGVFLLDVNRYARFKPIKIIGYNDEYAIIQSNVFYNKDGERISTVKLYDEVVRNASKVKEGQMIY